MSTDETGVGLTVRARRNDADQSEPEDSRNVREPMHGLPVSLLLLHDTLEASAAAVRRDPWMDERLEAGDERVDEQRDADGQEDNLGDCDRVKEGEVS